MIKPLKIIWFLAIVGIILGFTMIIIPAEGIEIPIYKTITETTNELGEIEIDTTYDSFNIHMPSFKDLFTKDTAEYADISDIVSNIDDIDSLPDITQLMDDNQLIADTSEQINPEDTVKANAAELAKSIYRIQFPKGNKSNLMKFFAKLKTSTANNTSIRIMHYGDSQIEGDRITSYLRNKLQKRNGGSGPGLLPALQPYESYFSIDQSNEGDWSRYPVFGKVDPKVENKRYGPLAAFSRFSPIVPDSLFNDSIQYHASIIFQESKLSYGTVRNFQKVRILYGNAKRPVQLKMYVDEQLINTDSLKSHTEFSVFEYHLATKTKNLKLEFSGTDSPDIYGIALDANTGVSVDNIGMRGSSGTIFKKMDFSHLKQAYDALDVQLFIMQFGGNVMPYIKDSTQAINYGRWFYSQLATMKKLRPDASIIVIGPSDMSFKVGEKFVTYPFLELVRDELKKATLRAGYGYWDMYEAMGGYNSMPSWVRSEPALAGADYTHFTPRGAKLIANMFYNALMIEALK